jgi:hypothetical protein
LQRASILINDGKFQEAFKIANKVWIKIRENGEENKLKEDRRNKLFKRLQGLENFDQAVQFSKENIQFHNNSVIAHIIAM